MFTDRRANSLGHRREKQPWPRDRPFKILSLDGGGIRGIYTAHLLDHCMRAFGGQNPLASYFDMIAGTSTGGIVALGLGLEFPTSDIVSFYRDDGRKIFPPMPKTTWERARHFLRWMRGPALDHEQLEKALRRRFRDRLLGECSTRIVVPAFMMPKTEIAVFKTDHHPDFQNDHTTPIWKVARATAAAPTYLRGLEHQESGRIFVDGGVWANNPVMVALVDALSAYDLEPDQIRILSIGTGNPAFELKRPAVFGGIWSWKKIIKAAMFLTTDNATAQVKLLLGPEKCLRVEPTGEAAGIELDDYDRTFVHLPDMAQKDFDANYDAIRQYFETTVVPRERHYSV
jgi:patatin-like phospholipase/acyl hydrolase